MNDHALSLPSGKSFHLTRCGVRIDGELDFTEWRELLASLQAVKHAYHCTLADVIAYGRERFGDADVASSLEQLEFELVDVTKAEAIGMLAYTFREKHHLTSEHYFVLSRVTEPERTKWAKIAVKQHLTALELKRSIECGKILRIEDIQAQSGQGTGITTIQGVVFRMQQWEKSMGGPDRILALPIPDRQNLLKLLTPAVELAAMIEQSLSN